jgi:hypothetical protein
MTTPTGENCNRESPIHCTISNLTVLTSVGWCSITLIDYRDSGYSRTSTMIKFAHREIQGVSFPGGNWRQATSWRDPAVAATEA